jgi:hypothetical protein
MSSAIAKEMRNIRIFFESGDGKKESAINTNGRSVAIGMRHAARGAEVKSENVR